MAKHEKRTRPGGEQGHSVLDGPEYIEGVPGQKTAKHSARKREDCDSVLDAPECIDGVDSDAREHEDK
jgi:hypothetical protein